MKKLVYATIACIFLHACSPSAGGGEKPLLMVSIPPQEAIAEAIAGDDFEIGTMLTHDANPETFAPSTSERVMVDEAEVFFATGVLPYEQILKNSVTNTPFVDTSKGVNLIYGTHGHDHGQALGAEEAPDPHYWSSIDGIRNIAINMCTYLKENYPDKANLFDRNLSLYETHLDSIAGYLSSALAKTPVRTFAVWHPSLSYLAKDYDLEQIAVGMDGKEMSAKNIREAIDHAKAEGVRVFFFQKEYDSRQAETINNGIGSRIVEINPLDKNWEAQLKLICDELSRP